MKSGVAVANFEIELGDGKRSVNGWVFGRFSVHFDRRSSSEHYSTREQTGGYVVSHLPSGRRIRSVSTTTAAEVLIQRISGFPEWDELERYVPGSPAFQRVAMAIGVRLEKEGLL